MVKNFVIFLLCLGLSSCAFNEYTISYNDALKAKTNIAITKEENLKELQERILGYLEVRGYKKALFTDQKKEFFVYSKEGDFQEPCQIILKYTPKAGEDKIRVDLVKGSDDLVTDAQVSFDIQKIAEQIKNNY